MPLNARQSEAKAETVTNALDRGLGELHSAADAALEDNVREFLVLIGEDPDRTALKESPRRIRKAWREWTSGYRCDPRRVIHVRGHHTGGWPLVTDVLESERS